MVSNESIKDANARVPSQAGLGYTTIRLPPTVAGRPNDVSQVEAANIAINSFNVIGDQEGVDQSIVWANSALVNTEKTVTYFKPSRRNQYYVLTVYNPSTVTDITARVYQKKRGLGGAERMAYLTSYTFTKTTGGDTTDTGTTAKILEFPYVNDDMSIVFSNDTVLGGSDGFTAYARLEVLI
jgi:hypothetical protein